MPSWPWWAAPASQSGRGGGGSCCVLEQKNRLLPPSLFNKINVLPLRLNEDLEALFVLSCGLHKRILPSLGAQPRVCYPKPSTEPDLPTQTSSPVVGDLVVILAPGCQHHEGKGFAVLVSDFRLQGLQGSLIEAGPQTSPGVGAMAKGKSCNPSKPCLPTVRWEH